MDAFYLPCGDGRFKATIAAQGAWDPEHQYGGAVAALLARESERVIAGAGVTPVRATCDFFGPVPVDEVCLTGQLVREGRRTRLVQTELHVDGRPRARMSTWWMREQQLGLVDATSGAAVPEVPPPAERPNPPFGYLRASERRFVRGSFLELGPAFVWNRTTVPLVDGETMSPLQRTLMDADIAAGVSATVDWQRYAFSNVELTVHLHRLPEGTWLGLDAVSEVDRRGVGLTRTVLWDRNGVVGTAAQALFVTPRRSAA